MANNIRRQVNRTNNTYRNAQTNGAYMYGNTAVKPEYRREYEVPEKQYEQPQRREVRKTAVRTREKAMTLGNVIFLVMGLAVTAAVLLGYVYLNAEMTTLRQTIAAQEKQLNDMRVENTETKSRIDGAVDLEEIKRVAILELGMTYPEEGQVISYEGAAYDYVRKVDNGN